MALKDIFRLDIQRQINGVISAGKDDDAELNVEFSEYVVTNDVSRSLNEFFEYYNEARPSKNGVWISGFFGSGKSHLLKILSYLLENGFIAGKSCFSYFEQKLSDDPLLLGMIRKGCAIPSESILFNIIQNNQIDKVGKSESILPIFLRQFYEHRGYYGADFVIAEMESELDEEGLLGEFIERFEALSGKKWCEAREKKNINRRRIVQAYAEVTGQHEDDSLLQNYGTSISIKGFAERVRKYIDSKGKDFRLNFFVDEAGQFVVKDARLMVELQEVATALADKCDNRAWVIVTSQDQLDKFIGSFENHISRDDVSKIQGRFYVKLKLTNQNVDEVIQKRLLLKNHDGRQLAGMIYSSKKDSFDALFGFVNGPKRFRCYRDENEFVNTYPFVTYQFDLFKAAFTELSAHGAFPGEYTSTGARSLLDIFHRVLNRLAQGHCSSSDNPVVPFDAFYEGIEDNLMDNFKQSIFIAENNIGEENPFALRVLKAMLLVKYISNDFRSTVHNISALLLTGFDENPAEVKRKTQDALNLLESQTYIQRKNSEEYDFLTNDEKDIETEIKREVITDDQIYDCLNTVIYRRCLGSVIKAKDSFGNPYQVTRQIDDRIMGPRYELGIVIATSYAGGLDSACLKYTGNELVIELKDDGKLFADIILSLQTDRYISLHDMGNFSPEKRLVAEQKRTLNDARKNNIEASVSKCLQSAVMYIKGVPLNIVSHSNEKARVEEGLRALVEKVYTNLTMIQGRAYNDAAVTAAFTDDITDMLEMDSDAERQILFRIDSEKRRGSNTTIKSLVDCFSHIPYGWPAQAVIYYVVILSRKGKLDIKQNGQELTSERIKALINQTTQWSSLMAESVAEVSPQKVKQLKVFYQDFASRQCSTDNAKGVVKELNDSFRARLDEIGKHGNRAKYPFLASLDEEKKLIESSMGRNTSWYFDSFLGDDSEHLLELEEEVTIPCLKFMSSDAQVGKYDEAYELLLKRQNELKSENSKVWQPIRDILDDPDVYRKSDVSKLPGLCDELNQYFSDELLKMKQSSLESINRYKASLPSNDSYRLLSDDSKRKVGALIEDWIERLKDASTSDAVGSAMYFGRKKVEEFISDEAPKPVNADVTEETPPAVRPVIPARKPTRGIASMPSVIEMTELSTKEEVEVFIGKLKADLHKAIDDGCVVTGRV
ncbi:MAG: BREX system P-loop protein BrxC [Bullifex sp.]